MAKPIYLYITPFFPSPHTWQGGFCMDAVKALQADGRYEVVVMTATDYGGDYEIEGIKVYQFARKRIGASEYFEWFLQGRNKRLFTGKLAQIGIKPEDVAVCHVHDYEHYVQYALAIKKQNPKCLTLVHHHFAGYYDLRVGKLGVVPIWSDLLYMKMRREFESVGAHVFISEHCRRCYGRRIDFDTGKDKGLLKNQLWLGALYRPIKLPDSYVWYNGVDTSVFNCNGRKERVGCFVIGCVGNFNPCKRQIDLIKAFELVVREIPDAKLKLVGDGKTYDECVEYVVARGMDKSVEFIAPMNRDKLADFYRSIDLLVTPSVNEGFCCVNAEANYCGTPAMAIRGLPIEEILNEAGCSTWLVAPHDIGGMAQRIIELAKDPQEQHFAIDLGSNVLARSFIDWTIEARGRLIK